MAAWISGLFGAGRHRKVEFAGELRIHDLVNLPPTSTAYLVKWKLEGRGALGGSSGAVEPSEGSTPAVTCSRGRVVWEARFPFVASLRVSREDDALLPLVLRLSVREVRGRLSVRSGAE